MPKDKSSKQKSAATPLPIAAAGKARGKVRLASPNPIPLPGKGKKEAEVLKPKVKKKAEAAKNMGAELVIVESPAKQRTISKILSRHYVVRSSYGHVRDLPESKLGVNDKGDFEPTYVLLPRTKKILPELKELSDKAPAIYLATDHDREGESIAWHLAHILEIPDEKIKRITFHEITPAAIEEALKAPREIDMHLVHAQQARRVIDRLVGYKLSPLLWKKVRRGLSAGRVQSVAVRLLVEREKEIKEFNSEAYWTLSASLEKTGFPPPFSARLIQWKGEKIESVRKYQLFAEEYQVRSTLFKTRPEINSVVQAAKGASFTVSSVERKELRRYAAPPFTTSTLQQAASQKFGFSAERIMRIAQSLYEGVDLGTGDPVGLITYMRTDSVSVAAQAQQAARRFIESKFGKEFLPEKPPFYKTKTRGAQEAHEAIRPTGVERTPEAVARFLEPDQTKVYGLIWKRFIASQMAEAVFDTVSVDIQATEALFRANGRTLKFEGFLKAYAAIPGKKEREPEELDAKEPDNLDSDKGADEASDKLPPLERGDSLKMILLEPAEHQTSPPPRYNEASLIRALEKNGIGRPSTYAPTIKTIVNRGYVEKGAKDRALSPSEIGVRVTEKLKEHFPDVVNLSYTADVEERLDRIAEGDDVWQQVVKAFYDPFQKELKAAQGAMEDTKPQETEEICPLCGSKMLLRESRFGKYLSCSKFPQCKGKARLNTQGEKVVPEATDEKCEVCGKPMVIRTGRKGRFLACSGYPACRNTYSLDSEGKKILGSRPIATKMPCNKCGSPFWLRMGKRGYFLACSAFPKCRNLKPVGKEEAERLKREAPSTSGSSGS